MTITALRRALATSALAALAGTALAQDQSGPNAGPATQATESAVAQAALAQQLYATGVARDDALTVLAAARLAAGVTAEDGKREVTQQPIEGAPAGEEPDVADLPAEAADMFAKARELAAGDDALLALIEDAEAEGSRGRIGGAVRELSRLPGGYSDVYQIPYYGGVMAEIAIVGDGDSNLDVLVTDENGNTICYDVSYSDKVYCSWVPIWNGNFNVLVENNGRTRNSYYLMTN